MYTISISKPNKNPRIINIRQAASKEHNAKLKVPTLLTAIFNM